MNVFFECGCLANLSGVEALQYLSLFLLMIVVDCIVRNMYLYFCVAHCHCGDSDVDRVFRF